MKIAFLAPHLRLGGGTKILFTYANLLTTRGHEVTVYVQSTNKIRRFTANLFQLRLPKWIPVSFRVVRIPAFESANVAPCDHIIAGGYQEALALINFPAKIGKGYYMIQHDEGLYHGDREAVDKALNSSLGKIVVSSWLYDVVKERTGQTSDILLNPYDRTQFFSTKKPKRNHIKILILDHTFAWKGTSEAIRLVRSLQEKYPNVQLVGLGRRQKDVANLYDEYHFDPSQNQLHIIYSDADIFLCSSWDEGFGLPSLEAMACGTAVVTYDNGGSRDFALDGETAFVAPRCNEQILSDKLENAIQDRVLRDAIAQKGKEFVESMPTWEEQVITLDKLLLTK